MTILSNDWWAFVWNTYSMTIVGIPSAITFILKLIAIFHPKVPTDAISGLFKEYWPVKKD
jgi:hypothetical protein